MFRKKYCGIYSLVILLFSIFLLGWYVDHRSTEFQSNTRIVDGPRLPEINPPEINDMERIRSIRKKLNLLANPRPGDRQVNLALFGYYIHGSLDRGHGRRAGDKRQPTEFDYPVTFAFVSDSGRYCYLDSKLYSEGDTLPDGGRIMEVESGKVLIRKNEMSKWVNVMDTAKNGGRGKN